MELLFSFFILIGAMLAIVIYQSRIDKPNVRVYLQRLGRLTVIIINYIKEVGVYAARRFKETNWNVTSAKVVRSLANYENNPVFKNANDRLTVGDLQRKKIDES